MYDMPGTQGNTLSCIVTPVKENIKYRVYCISVYCIRMFMINYGKKKLWRIYIPEIGKF